MGRWAPDARERLERAAVELFAEQGFAATTVPQIAARARLTTRTFYRHFEDKREVLFGGDEVPALAARLIVGAPPELDGPALVVRGLRIVAETRFEGRREELRRRRAIVRSDEGLGERDLHKHAVLSAAVRRGLVERGGDPRASALLADGCVSVLRRAVDEWLDRDDEVPLFAIVVDVLATFRTTGAAFAPALEEVRTQGESGPGG
jgi:AcrR family transcriptional regulator